MAVEDLTNILLEDAKIVCQAVNLNEILGKTILLTGASGLIGQNILASLAFFLKDKQQETKVFAVVQSQASEELKILLNFKGANLLQGDLTDYKFLSSLPEADYIIHAAGFAQPGRFLENPVKTLKLNTLTTFALLDKLVPSGKFLFISSSEIYSGLTTPSHKETEIGTTNLTHPRACYIEGKRAGEAICNAYRAKDIEAKSARVSLVYGPGIKKGDTRALYSFIDKALNKGNITLLDQGLAKRTYCYTTDIVEILWKILLFGKEAVYNVGGKSEVSIAELAQKIGKSLDAEVIFPKTEQGLSGAPASVSVDTSKIEQEFGKVRFVDWDYGLQKSIAWQKAL